MDLKGLYCHMNKGEMFNPKVTVIIFSYNQVDFIDEAVQSVLDQTYKNWELIISDNGSDDGTQEKLKKYKGIDNINLMLYESNGRITIRYNEAIQNVSGEYISVLYGDDYYLPEKIEEQIACFSNLSDEWGVVHGPGLTLDQATNKKVFCGCSKAHGENSLKDILLDFYSIGFINPVSPLVRTECYRNYPSYEDLFTEGESLYLKFALKYNYFFLEKPLVVMREHQTNAGWFGKSNIEILDACLERLPNFKEFPQNSYKPLNKLRIRNYAQGAWENVRLSNSMDSSWARSRLYKSLKLDSLQILRIKFLLSLFFTFLPNPLLRKINQLINILLKKKTQPYFDERPIK